VLAIIAADVFTIDITHNGRGIPADNQRHSGLANPQRRTQQVGGSCQITSPSEDGTTVRWVAPLPDV
jgi:signal transduction histidine kinase